MRYALPLAFTFVIGPFSHAAAQPGSQSTARRDSAIIALERRGWEAVKRKDTAAVFALTGGEFLYVQPWGMRRMSLANAPNAFANCETASYAMDSATVTPAGSSTAVLTYRLTIDQTCGGERVPSPIYVTEVWTQRNGKWVVLTRTDTIVQQGPTR